MNDTTVRRPLVWNSCAQSDVGEVREINEDAVLERPEIGLWVVADGMGGHEVGDMASQMIVSALEEIDNAAGLNAIVSTVENALIDANKRMLDYANIMLDTRTMGSTVICLIIRGRVGVCLWAGDSRLYRFRNQELSQLSRDHSQVQELLQQGFIDPEQAADYPDSNVITRAVGVDPEIYIDINVFTTQVGDAFLLCSDGLYNMVPQEDIVTCLRAGSVQAMAPALINKALENGAKDNVSVVVVKGEHGAVPRVATVTG